MNAFEKLESLLQSKAYSELTSEERSMVDQELTEETYEELREGIYLLKGEQKKMSNGVKQSLMAEFKQQRSPGFAGIFRKTVPAYSLIVPVVLFVLILVYQLTKEIPVIEDRIVEVTVRDTVQLIQTDTLWRDRIVEVKVPQLVYVANEEIEDAIEAEVSNKALSDQKEVLDLVVRGE
ncbi:MAG: hypothetical protein AAF391_02485 [Bacteroidota bacterium]